MTTTRSRMPLQAAALAAACLVLATPRGALAAAAPQEPAQPPAPRQANVVVEHVQNGPAFGFEFKYTEMNRDDAFLLGGYLGFLFDNKLLIGAPGTGASMAATTPSTATTITTTATTTLTARTGTGACWWSGTPCARPWSR